MLVEGHRAAHPLPSIPRVEAKLPERQEGSAEGDRELLLFLFNGPGERAVDVALFRLKQVQPGFPFDCVYFRLDPLGENQEPGGVPAKDGLGFVALLEALDAELAHHFKHGVARVARRRAGAPDEAVRDQSPELPQNIEGVIAADLLDGIEGTPATEGRDPPEQPLRRSIEQPMAPRDRLPQAALSLGSDKRTAAGQCQPPVELGQQRA